MRKVLILAYNFPPCCGGGVQRTAKFAKYLMEFGWNATVLTPDWRINGGSTDATMLADLADTEVVLTGRPVSDFDTLSKRLLHWLHRMPRGWRWCPTLRDNVLYPDRFANWKKDVLAVARPLLTSGRYDVLYSTSPPITAHVSAMRLKSEFALPWVADFRDPWTDNRLAYRRIWGIRKAIDRRLEQRVYFNSDAIIANTEANRSKLIDRCQVPSNKVVTIPNGYDEADFQQVVAERPQEQFRITYCGSAYADYTPQAFVDVLQLFLKRRPDARVCWTIAGNACEWAKKSVGESQVKEKLELLGYIPHQEVPKLLMSSHLLLQVYPKNLEYSVPGKIYEYLRSQTQVLAIGDRQSEVERVLRTTGCGQMFSPDQVTEAADFFVRMYDEWERGSLYKNCGFNNRVAAYDRRSQTQRLAGLFDQVSGSESLVKPTSPNIPASSSC